MKKILLLLVVLLLIGLTALYIVVPAKLYVSQIQYLPIPPNSVVRGFNNDLKKAQWWPSGTQTTGKAFEYNGLKFSIPKLNEAGIQNLAINVGETDTINSNISANQHHLDSSYLYWECTLNCTLSPFNRITQYLKASKIKKSMDAITAAFALFAKSTQNIYDIPIERVLVKDSVLISEKREFAVYPGTQEIYQLIGSLNDYAKAQNARSTGFPMIHTERTDIGDFSLMAAIPISHVIPEDANKKIKRLLYGGNLLSAEVKGGDWSVNNAFKQIEKFKDDYKLIAPAIPYESLMTDRTKVADTSLWVTKVYYPFY